MGYIIGVDGGGSKTLAIVAAETGTVVGFGRAGGSNYEGSLGLGGAMARIRNAVYRALDMAGIEVDRVDGAYFCLAGADLPEDFALLRPALEQLGFAPRVGLDNDSVAILRSGTDNPNAVAVGWGSGTNGVGRNAAGEEFRLLSLGSISGDWGGGGDLAEEAIRLVARAHDGRGEPTALTNLILPVFDVTTVDEMIRTLYFAREHRQKAGPRDEAEDCGEIDLNGDDRPDRYLVPLIFQAANAGDAVARRLVEQAAAEVTTTALALLRRLCLIDVAADVVLGGSILRAREPLLIEEVGERLSRQAPLAQVVIPDVEPVVGALYCGMDMLGIPVDAAVRERSKESHAAVSNRPAAEVKK